MSELNRRDFLRKSALWGTGGALLAGGFPALLAACSKDKSADTTAAAAAETTAAAANTTAAAAADTTAAAIAADTTAAAKQAADMGKMSLRLSWIKNSEFAGSYTADSKGYYKGQGFSEVELISGGPSAQPMEVDVASGKALFGISSPDITAAAIAKGAELIIVGVQYQKNPFCVMSLASKPVKTPEEMYGKKFGLQAANQVVWDAFVKASGIDDSKINKVPAQFDPQPLVNGETDTWFSFVTNEPNTLKVKGVDTYNFLLADFGYPLVSEVYFCTKDTLANKRDVVKAFLKAEILGWRDVYADPTAAGKITADVYGKDLGLDGAEQKLEVDSENLLIWTDETKANGIFTLSDELAAKNIETLAKAGLTITKEQLFDMSVINEIYAEAPEWKIPPA